MADEEKDEQTEAPEADAPEADSAAAEDAPKEAATEAAESPVPAGPAEVVHPKERRKRRRSAHSGEAKPERSDTDRAAERDVERKRKAASRSRYRQKQKQSKGEPGIGTPPAEREPGTQRLMQGIVVSSKADKSITVKVESARRHPSYEKVVRRSKNLHAHDESNEAGEGDTVRVIETRPMSKTKRWRLVEIMERAR